MDEFLDCLESCMLYDVRFVGSTYTWCNNQLGDDHILARLDQCLFYASDSDINVKVLHLPQVCSDHAPLLVEFS